MKNYRVRDFYGNFIIEEEYEKRFTFRKTLDWRHAEELLIEDIDTYEGGIFYRPYEFKTKEDAQKWIDEQLGLKEKTELISDGQGMSDSMNRALGQFLPGIDVLNDIKKTRELHKR